MKKTLQAIALILAIGATVQTFKAYANETGFFSAEEEESKMSLLIELRKELSEKGETFFLRDTQVSAVFPQITNSEQLNEAVARQVLRYIQAIRAEDALIRVIKQPEFQSLRERAEPGI